MSHDIYVLKKTGETRSLDVPCNLRGGTYAVEGSDEAWLNITYNYGTFYHAIWGYGLSYFNGKTVAQTLPLISKAIKKLGVCRSEDYWEKTQGNAGAAMADLLILLTLCEDDDLISVR